MQWKWYSDYEIVPSASKKNLTRDEIKESIELFRNCAKVHELDNFDTRPGTGHTLDYYCDHLIESAGLGYMVMAYNPSNVGGKATALFFQKSRSLSKELFEDVWVVSLAFEDSDFPKDDSEPAASRGFLRGRFNSELHRFMNRMRVDALYSIDPATNTIPNPWGRPISRIEFYGCKRNGVPDGRNGGDDYADWEQDGGDKWYSGPEPYHRHWAGKTGELGPDWWSFRVIKIKRR
jgi:hypothetical protein